MPDDSGFLTYKPEHLRKVNAIRRASSQPTLVNIVPLLTKGQLLFTSTVELDDKPASCYTCEAYNYGRSCMEIGPHVTIHKFVYPPAPTTDAKQVEYWPCCSRHTYGEPNHGTEKFNDMPGDPSNMGLIWINAPKVGQEYGGANCGGQNGGDDCDMYMTECDDKRAEPSAFCRALQTQVENGAVCAAWDDDDKIEWTKAQSLLKELEGGTEARSAGA